MRRPAHPFAIILFYSLAWLASGAPAVAEGPPLDLWTLERLAKIRDQSTLNLQLVPRDGYWDLFFDSEVGEAKWADSESPYKVHTGDTIRIHGYLAAPVIGGPYPALVIGHGHGGHGDADVAQTIAAFGFVVMSIDGPQAGLSTGGPRDTEQAWISVEEEVNQPSPEVSYLYHYIYAGMRALTALEALSELPLNPFRIDRKKLGVAGASMGGQFTYYINGIDDRVKAAIALAVAGDWDKIILYEGAWLYHGVYYYTRDGLKSGDDYLNTVSDVCADPTLRTFHNYFDPVRYAPTQHGPLLTIVGTHDQYFLIPAMNTTYDKVASAEPNPRFIKRILITPNAKHAVVDNGDLWTILSVIGDLVAWLKYAFENGPLPPETPTVEMSVVGGWMKFRVRAPKGTNPILRVDLHLATQLDSTVARPCDFASIRLFPWDGNYIGFVPVGFSPPCGPPATPHNVLYYASAKDWGPYTISSKVYYKRSEMEFCSDFVPRIEHWQGDDFPVPTPPSKSCFCQTPSAP